MKRAYLLIGVCQRPHGVKGEVLVKSLTDDDQRFFQGLTCTLLDHPDAPAGKSLTLSAARPVPQGLLLTFEGIMTREEARRLGGSYLAVRRQDALPLESPDEFYTGDLIGMRVKDSLWGDLGAVADVMNAGSGDILIVAKEGDKEVLIPFLRNLVLSVDLDSNLIEVQLPQGLIELYRQTPSPDQET